MTAEILLVILDRMQKTARGPGRWVRRRSGCARPECRDCVGAKAAARPLPASFPPDCAPCGAESRCPGCDRPAARRLRSSAAPIPRVDRSHRRGRRRGRLYLLVEFQGEEAGWPDRDRWRQSSQNRVRLQRAGLTFATLPGPAARGRRRRSAPGRAGKLRLWKIRYS
jgi:hypothetical protein